MTSMLRALALLGLLAVPVAADDGTCAVPLYQDQGWVGQQLLVNQVVELQSPGSVYVCADLPDNMAGTRVVLRRQLPHKLGIQNPVLDSCISFLDMGSHPIDGFARVQITDRAGSFQCVEGPDAVGSWQMIPARRQVYHVTWYITP